MKSVVRRLPLVRQGWNVFQERVSRLLEVEYAGFGHLRNE